MTFNIVEVSDAPPSSAAMNGGASESIGLLDIDDDILCFIIESFLLLDVDALAMSAVCRRLRSLSLSLIFHDVRWPQSNRKGFYPPALWPYIRRLSFTQVQWKSSHDKSMDILAKILPSLSNLISFDYQAERLAPTLTFVASLANSSASLTALELTTVFFSHDALNTFSLFSGLYHLAIKQPDGTTLLSAPAPKRITSVQCVANLILACYKTLAHLELPGEFCPSALLASGRTKFLALKTLILHGYPPLDADSYPMWKVLNSMPRLSRLEVFCRLRVMGASVHRYVLMPNDTQPEHGMASLFPSLLESLSIANPSLADYTFMHLPPTLEHLFLDFIPDWENMLSSRDSLGYHRPGQMRRSLAMMRRAYGSAGVAGLQKLCIKMGWCATPEILLCVCDLFPNLISLELQGIRYFDRNAESEPDMNRCVSSLATLRYIRTLKLAIQLPEDPYRYASDVHRNVGSVEEAAQKWADALALRLRSLQMIAFETSPHTGRALGPRPVFGQPSWAWFTVENGVARRNTEYVEVSLDSESGYIQGRKSRQSLPQAPRSYQPI